MTPSPRTGLRILFLLLAALGWLHVSHADTRAPVMSAREASSAVGQRATVCGMVASARFAESVKGAPTFLNLDEPYPRQVFTIVIWGSDRQAFGSPESTYTNKRICVTGTVESYRGKPEIIARAPSQIEIK